jgi:hypothetical protein
MKNQQMDTQVCLKADGCHCLSKIPHDFLDNYRVLVKNENEKKSEI